MGATTRRGRFLERQARYRRRRKRRYNSGRYDDNDHVSGQPWRWRPPYDTGGDGGKQKREVLRKWHPSGNVVPLRFLFPWETFTIVHTGRKRAPHCVWTVIPLGTGFGAYNATEAFLGYVRRPVQYQGHKIGRLSGDDYLRARARQYYLSTGGEFYPRWDPDQREPQEPE